MKNYLCLLLLSFSLLNFESSFAQKDTVVTQVMPATTQTDTSSHEARGEHLNGDNDVSLILIFLPALLISILISALTAIILSAVGALFLFGFISWGIVSTSLLVGLWKRSFTKGFKVFILLFSCFGGLLTGGLTFGAFNLILHWAKASVAILCGCATGAVCGLIFGYIAFYIIKKLIVFLMQKLDIKSEGESQ